jgi:hypothetical protein
MRNTLSTITRSVLLVSALGLVFGFGTTHALLATESQPCENNMCSLETGNCFPTDMAYNCSEIVEAPGCRETKC